MGKDGGLVEALAAFAAAAELIERGGLGVDYRARMPIMARSRLASGGPARATHRRGTFGWRHCLVARLAAAQVEDPGLAIGIGGDRILAHHQSEPGPDIPVSQHTARLAPAEIMENIAHHPHR